MPRTQRELSDKEQAYVREFLIDLNKTRAYLRAGYKECATGKDTSSAASNLHRTPRILSAVKKAMDERAERNNIDADQVLLRWAAQHNADPAKIVSLRYGACRYCHGEGHDYQWRTTREFEEAFRAHGGNKKKPAPNDNGGYGYNSTAKPHPHCPECDGIGLLMTKFTETSTLTGNELALYEGVKETRDGLEVKLASRSEATMMLARHLGMFPTKVEHSGKDGKPIETESVTRIIIVPAKVPAPAKVEILPPDDEE